MTDRQNALIDLRDKVKAGEWPGGADGAARKVFPYTSSSYDDRGILAAEAFDGYLDAAHALHKAMLGDGYISTGWKYCIWGHGMASVWNVITGDSAVGKIDSRELHSVCAARAWLLAILEALIAEAD